MSSPVTLPPKPYNIETLGGRVATLWDLAHVTQESFQDGVHADAWKVAQFYGVADRGMTGPASFDDAVFGPLQRAEPAPNFSGNFKKFEDFRTKLLGDLQQHLANDIGQLALHAAPWHLRNQDIPEVGAFRIFAQAGVVPEDAANDLIGAARCYVENIESMDLSLSERIELTLIIWRDATTVPHPGINIGSSMSTRQACQMAGLLYSYGLPSLERIYNGGFREHKTAIRAAFQADLLCEYADFIEGLLSVSIRSDMSSGNTEQKDPTAAHGVEELSKDKLDELFCVGLIDQQLYEKIHQCLLSSEERVLMSEKLAETDEIHEQLTE